MNNEDSVDDPHNIQHNEELVFINVNWIRSEENNIKENRNEFERNIFILNYHFSFFIFQSFFTWIM